MELVVRFLLGGTIVSLFAVIGELFKPKTFSGIFGAAPSVAIASLALAFGSHGATYARIEARSMVLGAIALLAYGETCVLVLANARRVPVWLVASGAWVVWLAVAAGLHEAFG